ncbi:MAG: hypothetical protein NTV81_04155 [Candidatus Komeilibacteria bacterium]|nr:hypothetical protein [Candidatus Komeilibacteria bacterium]
MKTIMIIFAVALLLPFQAEAQLDTTTSYKVVVDYSESMDRMIAKGSYEGVHPWITRKHFPIIGSGREEAEVFFFVLADTEVFDLNQIRRDIDSAGCFPVNLAVLLALGATYQQLQKQFYIFSIAQSWEVADGMQAVVALSFGEIGRNLDCDVHDGSWMDNRRIAVIRKPKK